MYINQTITGWWWWIIINHGIVLRGFSVHLNWSFRVIRGSSNVYRIHLRLVSHTRNQLRLMCQKHLRRPEAKHSIGYEEGRWTRGKCIIENVFSDKYTWGERNRNVLLSFEFVFRVHIVFRFRSKQNKRPGSWEFAEFAFKFNYHIQTSGRYNTHTHTRG